MPKYEDQTAPTDGRPRSSSANIGPLIHASECGESVNEVTRLAHALGHRNRAGAPLGPQSPSYDAHLAMRLLTAAHEVMQRVVASPTAVGGDRKTSSGDEQGSRSRAAVT